MPGQVWNDDIGAIINRIASVNTRIHDIQNCTTAKEYMPPFRFGTHLEGVWYTP